MEDEPQRQNFFENTILLNSNENLDSEKLEKSYILTCIIEDNMFKITARDDETTFLLQFRLVDWVTRKEKDFVKLVNNYELILDAIREGFEKGRIVLYKIDSFSLKLIIYYTIIFKEGSISFELHEKSEDEEEEKRLISQFYSESEPIIQENDPEYRAEKINYINIVNCIPYLHFLIFSHLKFWKSSNTMFYLFLKNTKNILRE